MATLSNMKARIASELRRDDLTSDIADAITTAIVSYDNERFWFNQTRSAVSFNSVATQDIYTSADEADIANIIRIEYGFVTVGGFAVRLWPRQAADIEECNLGSAALSQQPHYYSWFAESIRLEPIPNAVYALRFGCIVKIAAPATDGETGNRWMTDAELLIRSRAKAEIYAHVSKKADQASTYYSLANNELLRLRDKTKAMVQPEDCIVESWNPYG